MIRVEQLNNKDFYVRDLEDYVLIGQGTYDEHGKATLTDGMVPDAIELAEALYKPHDCFDKNQEDLIALSNIKRYAEDESRIKLGIMFMPHIDIVIGDMHYYAQYVPGLSLNDKFVELRTSDIVCGSVGYAWNQPIVAQVIGEWLIIIDHELYWIDSTLNFTATSCFGSGIERELKRVTNITQLWENICVVKEKCADWDRGISKPVKYR